ncbi:MAG: hypothetical protein JO048_06365 [Methylobacteriaceae bacterium]|nr:hypothetical protein [Methylobacteriaceae bacterium]
MRLLPAVLLLVALPGAADAARVRATRTDLAPAASTQYAPPDGGIRYRYPPDTSSILRPQDRTPYDVPTDRPARRKRAAR